MAYFQAPADKAEPDPGGPKDGEVARPAQAFMPWLSRVSTFKKMDPSLLINNE